MFGTPKQTEQYPGVNQAPSGMQVEYSQLPIPRSDEYSTLEPSQPREPWRNYDRFYAKESPPYATQGPAQTGDSRRRVFGLTIAVFLFLVALFLVTFLVGGVVGGVIGASVFGESSNSDSNSSPTATVTKMPAASASASSLPVPTVGISQLYCSNQTTYHTSFGGKYLAYCGVNWANYDIKQYWSATFKDCMNDCDKWNAAKGGQKCQAVTYNANLTDSNVVSGGNGNCYLKTEALDYSTPATVQPLLIASAKNLE